ncbi:TrbC/VirB2 family protein [Candidatus Uhrbacteria bacterium]|nr:TrbC/VirB2 family protein [Candidatus Uhrbacteria bacterium]
MKRLFFTLFSLILSLPSSALAAQLVNPLGKGATIELVIGRIIRAILGLSGVAALAMFVWGGFLWLTSRGEPKQVTQGKETLKWAVLGLIVIFGAYTLVNALVAGLTTGSALEAPSEASG